MPLNMYGKKVFSFRLDLGLQQYQLVGSQMGITAEDLKSLIQPPKLYYTIGVVVAIILIIIIIIVIIVKSKKPEETTEEETPADETKESFGGKCKRCKEKKN